jgi:hypothetical protein
MNLSSFDIRNGLQAELTILPRHRVAYFALLSAHHLPKSRVLRNAHQALWVIKGVGATWE